MAGVAGAYRPLRTGDACRNMNWRCFSLSTRGSATGDHAAHDEHRLRVAHAERLQRLVAAEEIGVEFRQRDFRVHAQAGPELFVGEERPRDPAKIPLEIRERRFLHGQARRHLVPAEFVQQRARIPPARRPATAPRCSARCPCRRPCSSKPMTSVGRWCERISRDATIPSTPGCQPRAPTTMAACRERRRPSHSAESCFCASSERALLDGLTLAVLLVEDGGQFAGAGFVGRWSAVRARPARCRAVRRR